MKLLVRQKREWCLLLLACDRSRQGNELIFPLVSWEDRFVPSSSASSRNDHCKIGAIRDLCLSCSMLLFRKSDRTISSQSWFGGASTMRTTNARLRLARWYEWKVALFHLISAHKKMLRVAKKHEFEWVLVEARPFLCCNEEQGILLQIHNEML